MASTGLRSVHLGRDAPLADGAGCRRFASCRPRNAMSNTDYRNAVMNSADTEPAGPYEVVVGRMVRGFDPFHVKRMRSPVAASTCYADSCREDAHGDVALRPRSGTAGLDARNPQPQ
jgi:hypothetical protein